MKNTIYAGTSFDISNKINKEINMILAKDNQQVIEEQDSVLAQIDTEWAKNNPVLKAYNIDYDKIVKISKMYNDGKNKISSRFDITPCGAEFIRSELRKYYLSNIPNGYVLANFGKRFEGRNDKYYINIDGFMIDKNNRKVRCSYEHRKFYHRFSATLRDVDGKNVQRHYAHRVIALTFIDNPFGYEQVNHKNGIHNDNRVCNLEFMSNAQNYIHSVKQLATRVGKDVGEKNGRAKLTDEKVKMYRKLYADKMINTIAIALIENIDTSNVVMMLNGGHWSHIPDHIDEVKERMLYSISSETIENISEVETLRRISE